jgi:5-carboxymethyl-2-hydroxymuconate isomerase
VKLATVRHRDGTALVSLSEQGVVDLTAALGGDPPLSDLDALCGALTVDPTSRLRIAEATASGSPRWAPNEVTILAPLRHPSKIVCVGLNYLDHCRETGVPAPTSPVIFSKFPSSIIGPGEPIVLHQVTKELDWEVELVAVIGETVGPENRASLGSLLGYTIGNDVSARDLQRQEGQWVRAKSLDSWCPLGPVVVTPDELGDPQALALGLRVNGEAQQESNTAEMVFSVSELLEWLTATVSLLPGDLLFTGTPHGTGGFQQPPRYLTSGDVVEAWIAGIGSFTNVVRAEPVANRQ